MKVYFCDICGKKIKTSFYAYENIAGKEQYHYCNYCHNKLKDAIKKLKDES